jgi:hypothetical protein
MPAKTSADHWLQFVAVAIIGIFILGFVFSPVGAWTGPILAAWLVGTQKPARISNACRHFAHFEFAFELARVTTGWN